MPGLLQPERRLNRIDAITLEVEVKSLFSGQWNKMTLPITQDQWRRWQQGELKIQHAMPNLDNDQREFLMSGATPEEWERLFGGEEEEEGEGGDD